MRTEILEDGTVVRKLPPIDGMPMYSHWLGILLERGLAHIETELDPRNPGSLRERIVPNGREQEQAAVLTDRQQVSIICIGCGIGCSKMNMNTIRIGGLIQMSYDEIVGDKELVSRWRVQPVSKTGLGCPSCQVRYDEAVVQTARQNDERQTIAAIMAYRAELRRQITIAGAASRHAESILEYDKSRCLHGLQMAFCSICLRQAKLGNRQAGEPLIKSKSMLTAFIDVFTEVS